MSVWLMTRCCAEAAAPASADVSEGDLDAAMRGAADDDDAAAADAQAAEEAAEAAEFNAEVLSYTMAVTFTCKPGWIATQDCFRQPCARR
jgi:hypothetical protein